jgi:hypothetical protein
MNTAAQPPGWPRQEHQVPERMTNSPRGRPLAPGAYTLVGWLAAAAGGQLRQLTQHEWFWCPFSLSKLVQSDILAVGPCRPHPADGSAAGKHLQRP